MSVSLEDALDDVRGLEAGDPGDMLRATASAAAQVREAAVATAEAGVSRLVEDGRPRAVVVTGMGGSGIAGDVLSAVAGLSCPVPLVVHRGFGLPAWVGPLDLVIAVSCSGTTTETIAVLEEAVRRGCRVMSVSAPDSPLEALALRGRGVAVPVSQGRQPRATIWGLSTPLLVAGDALGLLQAPPETVEAAAVALEGVAARCRVDAEHVVNPAKRLALELDGRLPVVWGTSGLTGVAAYRFACQLNENACSPAVHGTLPEAGHNQVVALDGAFGAGGGSAPDPDDFFRDRADDSDADPRLHLVLLRDADEHPLVARRAEVVAQLAQERGLGVSVLEVSGASSFERLAGVVGTTDYASVYLALLQGTDPTPIAVLQELKDRSSR